MSISEVKIFPYNLFVFATVVQYCLYERHTLTKKLYRADSLHFATNILNLFKKLLTNFWTTKTADER